MSFEIPRDMLKITTKAEEYRLLEDLKERRLYLYREIEPLGDDLRTDKDVGLATVEPPEHLVHGGSASGGVPIDPGDPRSGEQLSGFLFDLLGAGTHRYKASSTNGASTRIWLMVPAVVAFQGIV